jgi:hypothetical protein
MTNQPDEILAIDEVAACLQAGQHKVYPLAANANISGFKRRPAIQSQPAAARSDPRHGRAGANHRGDPVPARPSPWSSASSI